MSRAIERLSEVLGSAYGDFTVGLLHDWSALAERQVGEFTITVRYHLFYDAPVLSVWSLSRGELIKALVYNHDECVAIMEGVERAYTKTDQSAR